ncbi:hypothetical protein E1B28_008798 [Marasmius oreades]|nr:uncharacterized protein E1B28_008798 [Marasmius oreades]KAG7092443.1 hypothetical protein E1B28_008798 [Marasmius oreades]
MVDALVAESTRIEQGATGGCLEYLLKNDVLGTLVRLSESDRPYGIQAEVLRAVQNMVVLLDEQFLVHSAVHKAVLRLLRTCVGDDLQEQLDGRRQRVMGAAGNSVRSQPSEFEEDLVNLLCILCSRIRTYRELLMIFFHDKHWYRSEPLFAVEEKDEDDEDEEVSDSGRMPSPAPSHTTVTTTTQVLAPKTEYEFLLFNYLLRFVHREGQIGEFARAGLLLLMDVAMSPDEPVHRLTGEETDATDDPITEAALALADYILDGDFSEVLAAGLGAVYSLLPSKIEFRPVDSSESNRESGMVIGSTWLETEDEREMLEVARSKSLAMGIEDANNSDFRSRLDHFLKLLEFLQDVLRRNIVQDNVEASSFVGTAIVNSILDAVRRIFLENVLYPAVLECSDTDGSAVAVMSYIEIMVRVLQEGQMADLLVSFLVSEDNEEVRQRQRPHSLMMLNNESMPPRSQVGVADKKSRRKSSAMAILEIEAPETKKQSEYFTSTRFTLKDLLLTNLRSKYQPSVTSALQLFQSILLQHSQLCTDMIISVLSDPDATAFPHPALLQSVMVGKEDHDDDDDETFTYPVEGERETKEVFHHLPHATFSTHEREMDLYRTLVSRIDPSHDSDPFSTGYEHYLRDALFAIQDQGVYRNAPGVDPKERIKSKHRMNMNDPIISNILDSLRTFFSNTPECNIALTGALATLAIHPDRSLAGWLTFASNDILPPNDANMDFDLDGDGDDRSIDFQIAEKLAAHSYLPASSMDANSRPVVHAIFHGLVAQLERYRQQVSDFDKFLLERRQGLLFSENLTDALSLVIELSEEPTKLPSTPVQQQQNKLKAKSSASSTIISLLTPKKNKAKMPTVSSSPSTPSKRDSKGLAASPFAPHYRMTASITVEPFVAPAPVSGPWSPPQTLRWCDEEDVFSSGWSTSERRRSDLYDTEQESSKPAVTLSHLLDNVVILEESIKELVAIIHARRSLGIDAVRFL